MTCNLTPDAALFEVYPGTSPVPTGQLLDDLKQARREIELLKTMDPFRAVEMAIGIQLEKQRVEEAIGARDVVVQRFADACSSLRQKVVVIDSLRRSKASLEKKLKAMGVEDIKGEIECKETKENRPGGEEGEIMRLEGIIQTLQDELKSLKGVSLESEKSPNDRDPPPRYEQDMANASPVKDNSQLTGQAVRRVPFRVLREDSLAQGNTPSLPSPSATLSPDGSTASRAMNMLNSPNDMDPKVLERMTISDEPEVLVKARHAILAALPLPSEIPDDALKPILIPSPFTLHEFLANASGSLRSSLVNYRVFQQPTTYWCPDREEHGYMLTPLYKCSTNPRVAAAHRWAAVDVLCRIDKATECFYNKDGKWYYAGIYQGFRLDDLTTKEWEVLSAETAQALIKETISGRKNTSPQNLYETGQLYSAGALKIACVGLQCVGFNNTMYRAILDHASKCAVAGRWKADSTVSVSPGLGIGIGAGFRASSAGVAGDPIDKLEERDDGTADAN